mmetsp:Transcript_2982/g.3154  ORF Transcript_2982/g.3154 Transcript_2982/m.3154 type:complete len:174 (+) Transcript_2982:193-714(+)
MSAGLAIILILISLCMGHSFRNVHRCVIRKEYTITIPTILYSSVSPPEENDLALNDDEEDEEQDEIDASVMENIENIVAKTGDVTLLENMILEDAEKAVNRESRVNKFQQIYKDIKGKNKNITVDATDMLASLFEDEQVKDVFNEKKIFVKLRNTLDKEDFTELFDPGVGDFL